MKTLIFTLAFAAVMWGCSEETITCMPTSKSLPIEFYDIDEPVYNEEEYPGVYKPCFCQPWKCGTPLSIQVPLGGIDLESADMVLKALDADSVEIASWNMSQIGSSNNVGITIDPQEDLCDKKVSFRIDAVGIAEIPEFDGPPVFGTTKNIGGNSWGQGDPSFIFSNSEANDSAPFGNIMHWPAIMHPGTYTLDFHVRRVNGAGNAGPSRFYVVGLNAALDVVSEQEFQAFSGADLTFGNKTKTGTFQFVVDEEVEHLGVWWHMDYPSPTVTISHEVYSLTITDVVAETTPLYKSDCVDFKEEFPDMDLTLIQYWDVRDWDDLIYPQSSPFQAFNLWVPATFWKPRNVSEQTEHRTSGKRVVKMNSTMIKQKLFETDHLPIEFHEKILHVLSHNQVWINSRQYTNGEGYVVEEDASNRFAFQKATAWLTDAESVLNNVI